MTRNDRRTETTPRTVAEQLDDVYGLIDDLQTVEQRLRAAVDAAMTQLKEEHSPSDDD